VRRLTSCPHDGLENARGDDEALNRLHNLLLGLQAGWKPDSPRADMYLVHHHPVAELVQELALPAGRGQPGGEDLRVGEPVAAQFVHHDDVPLAVSEP